ncbi:MAG: response regulator, partial [Lachnospiraceae bacterium]|nr:response regulator [Lachnospiraceae bacterium]
MQKILVVDDAAVNREMLREMLEDSYAIEMAENGHQALRKLLQYKEELTAVLLDLQMPEMDGFAVITAMRENGWLE